MNYMTAAERIRQWDIKLGIEKSDELNEVDLFYKKISRLILTRGGEILPADNPKQLKIGYVWFVEENGVEVYKNPEISIIKIKKYFSDSKFGSFFDSSVWLSQEGKINICQELQNPRSEIHKLYFSEAELEEFLLLHNMNEALS